MKLIPATLNNIETNDFLYLIGVHQNSLVRVNGVDSPYVFLAPAHENLVKPIVPTKQTLEELCMHFQVLKIEN